MMRTSLAILTLLLLALLAGCGIEKQPLSGDQIGQYWYLEEDPWPGAVKPQWHIAGHRIPTKFTILKKRSADAAIFSLVRTGFEVMQGADEVQVGITPEEATGGANLLRRARLALVKLQANLSGSQSADRWAKAVSEMLVTAEDISRVLEEASGGEAGKSSRTADEIMGYQMLLQVVVGQFSPRANVAFGNLQAGQTALRINDALMDGLLELSFGWAGKQTPPKARQRVQEQFAKAHQPNQAQPAVQDILMQYLREAPPAEGDRKAAQFEMALKVAPMLLEELEDFARQWDKLRSVSLEFRTDGQQTIGSVTLDVEPGQNVRLAMGLMPTLVFTGGSCRITLVPTDDATRETLILFQSQRGGSCEIRYEGLVYALARLVVPVDNAVLREIRLQRHGTYRGWNLTNVELLMNTNTIGQDNRRMYAMHFVQFRQPVRGPFDVDIVSSHQSQSISYLRPAMRYTWRK